jgi:hypothetical protein
MKMARVNWPIRPSEFALIASSQPDPAPTSGFVQYEINVEARAAKLMK